MRRLALGSVFGGAVWHFGWEAVRAWLYEQGFHVVNPYLFGIQLSWILHYGGTAALVCLGLWLFWKTRPSLSSELSSKNERATEEFASDIPDVRIADDAFVWRLFYLPKERDKLIPLLEAEKLQAWGRLGDGHPALTKIPTQQWSTHFLDLRPAFGAGTINQTFFRPRARPYESTYYDVFLNRRQLSLVWPEVAKEELSLYEAASIAYSETRGTVVSDLAEVGSESPLLWYVRHFFVVSEIPVHGNIKFSSKRERVPTLKGYMPELRPNNQIILKDIDGNKDWENLTVNRSDLTRDFEKLQETAAEIRGA